jgi:DnaJ-class molecular chaperone
MNESKEIDISSSGYPGHPAKCPRCGKDTGWEYPDGRKQECEPCCSIMKNHKDDFEKERMTDKTRFSETCSRCCGSGTTHSNDDDAWEIPCPKCGGMGLI